MYVHCICQAALLRPDCLHPKLFIVCLFSGIITVVDSKYCLQVSEQGSGLAALFIICKAVLYKHRILLQGKPVLLGS